jgi:hypothetical protein
VSVGVLPFLARQGAARTRRHQSGRGQRTCAKNSDTVMVCTFLGSLASWHLNWLLHTCVQTLQL